MSTGRDFKEGETAEATRRVVALLVWLIKVIGPCPTTGRHAWIWKAALKLKACDEETSAAAIRAGAANCGREVPEKEIRDAVINARRTNRKPALPAWPKKNPKLIREAQKNGVDVAALRRLSPADPALYSTDQIVDLAYPGSAGEVLLCVGKDTSRAITRPKGACMGAFSTYPFIVPNAMTAITGITQDGHKSQRALANTGKRRFLVTESDPIRWQDLNQREKAYFKSEESYLAAKKDEAAAVIWHLNLLASQFPLVLVVDSGGKSLHAWFLVEGFSEEQIRKFFRYAVAAGADAATWTKCQWVRMPGGLRDNGKRQAVIYFNPEQLKVQ
jgi:hypothetical protein